jgi:hypothetical protein
MASLKVGDRFTAYFGQRLETATVVEWQGSKCFFDNGWYLVWAWPAVGFLY